MIELTPEQLELNRAILGWFVGRIRKIPGRFSQGETLEALENNVAEVLSVVAG